MLNDRKGAKLHKARAVPYAFQSKVESTLLKMEKDGVIQRVTSSVSAAPIVVVGKKESEDVRVCGDFSVTYNAYADVETYPMPQIEDMHSALRGCTVFSVLDIKQAYHQIPIYSINTGTWKTYIRHLLKDSGGLLLFSCNYDIKDLNISSQFYMELLHWWSKFRDDFTIEKDWQVIIWNNQAIRINNKPIFYKKYYSAGILAVDNLRFDLSNTKSFELIAKDIEKTNFLEWTGIRHSIPSILKVQENRNYTLDNIQWKLSFKTENGIFDTTTKRSRDHYALIISKKALSPSNGQKLKYEFDLSDDDLKQVFSLAHSIAFEPYVKAFEYKVLNFILYTNYKLYKIGYIEDDSCSFCKLKPETLHHFFFYCTHARRFWHEFESYYSDRTNQSVRITLRDICVGIINSECRLLNYLSLKGKLYVWDCRRSNKLPNIAGFKVKVDIKLTISSCISVRMSRY